MYVYHVSAKKEKKKKGSWIFEKDGHADRKKGIKPEKGEREKEDYCGIN